MRRTVGILDADENIFIRSYLNYDLTCELPFLPGDRRYEVSFNSKFDYVTSAYLKRYFIKEDLMDEFASSGSPESVFFSQYDISDRNPVSIYSAGPVELGITTANVLEPLSLENGARTSFKLKVGISNARSWDGEIYAINDILLSIPFGFSIKSGGVANGYSCTLGGLKSNMTFLSDDECASMNSPFKDLDCNNYYHFRITPADEDARTSIQVDESNTADQELLISCDIEATNPSEILGGVAFSTDSFRARVAYTYEIEETKSFTVKERETDGIAIPAGDESLSALTYCGVSNAYLIEPNYELVFSYNDDKQTEFEEIKETVLDAQTNFMSSTDLTTYSGLGCFEKNIFWAYTMQFWDQVSASKSVGNTYYGYMRTTEDMWEYVYENDNTFENPNFLSVAEKNQYLEQNNVLIGSTYLTMMRELCVDDSTNPELTGQNAKGDIVCAVGKYVCGENFVYGDYSSCTSSSLCTLCHDRYIPNIVTLAAQIAYYDE